MKITPEIIHALQKSIDHHGNVTQFAKSLGIAHSTVLFWLSGKTTEINGRIWAQKLRPELTPFLEQEAAVPPELFPYQLGEPRGEYTRTFHPDRRERAAVIPWERIAELDVTVEPVREFIERLAPEKTFAFAAPLKDSYFAVEFTVPELPFKLAMLIASGEYPRQGDVILAKLRDKERIVAGRFFKENNTLTIELLFPPEREILTWNFREHPGFLCWIFPVVEIQSDLRGEL